VPLLGWLSEPEWAIDNGMNRLRIIQSVVRLGLTDAIPHLAHVVAHDQDESKRSYAAEALAQFRDDRASDAMRAALRTMTDGYDRERLVRALIALGSLDAAELAQGLEAYVVELSSRPDGAPRLDPLSSATPQRAEAIIGMSVAMRMRDRDDVATLVIERAGELEKAKPAVASMMREVIQSWNVPSVHTMLLHHIEAGTAGAGMIEAALHHREQMSASHDVGLRRLLAGGGTRAGIAAVLTGDQSALRRVLDGGDRQAQRALLACARLERVPIPIASVSTLFGHSPELDAAAESWLIAEDSVEARAIVQARHPGEILILGSRLPWDPGHHADALFDHWERDLLSRFRASPADEWIVLGAASYWSGEAASVAEIQIREEQATLVFDVDSVRRTVPLSSQALGELRLFLTSSRFDELGPIDTGVHDGVQYEYLHLTGRSGRRIYMNNPGFDSSTPHGELVERIHAMVETARAGMRDKS
jgi:hypothetical protein